MKKVTNIGISPFNLVGQLNFKMDGQSYDATAFVVSNKGIFTAAHNLYDYEEKHTATEAYFSLWVNGKMKTWALDLGADGVIMPDEWIDDGDDNYDMAVCVIKDESFKDAAIPLLVYDKNLQEGFKFQAMAIGFQGENGMYYCEGEATALEEGIVLSGDMVEGASGGPWMNGTNVYGSTRDASGTDLASPNNGVTAKELIDALNKV